MGYVNPCGFARDTGIANEERIPLFATLSPSFEYNNAHHEPLSH